MDSHGEAATEVLAAVGKLLSGLNEGSRLDVLSSIEKFVSADQSGTQPLAVSGDSATPLSAGETVVSAYSETQAVTPPDLAAGELETANPLAVTMGPIATARVTPPAVHSAGETATNSTPLAAIATDPLAVRHAGETTTPFTIATDPGVTVTTLAFSSATETLTVVTPVAGERNVATRSETTSNHTHKKNYFVTYKDNGSKKWDGKEILIDGETLEGLYSPSELEVGKVVQLPYTERGGKVKQWNAVISEGKEKATTGKQHNKKATKQQAEVKKRGRKPKTESRDKGKILRVGCVDENEESFSKVKPE